MTVDDNPRGNFLRLKRVKGLLAEARLAQPREYDMAIFLWLDLHDQPEQQKRAGTSMTELIGLVRRYGNYIRGEITKGNPTALPSLLQIMWPNGPWEHTGISPTEIRPWTEAWGKKLYAEMDAAHTENAVHILKILFYIQMDWEKVLGAGSENRLATAAIHWCQWAYAYLHKADANEDTVRAVGKLLTTFAAECYFKEVVYADRTGPCVPIYRHLGFSAEEAIQRYDNLMDAYAK